MANKKKRFGGGSALVKGIVDTVRSNELGEEGFNVELLGVGRIKPDPKNPRLLGLTEDELSWLQNEKLIDEARQGRIPVEERTKTLLKLRDLADSIASNGLLQPIRVYRVGDEFRIESGERRYWGSILAKQDKIPAIILKAKPARLRTFQLIENLQRDDLSLTAKIRNIASVVDELEGEEEGRGLTSTSLGDVIGTSRRQASKYLSIIRGHQLVMKAISSGVIDNLDVAVDLGKIENEKELLAAIKSLSLGESHLVKKRKKASTTKAKGRPATQIRLGATKSNKVVQHIMRSCLIGESVEEIDWDDFKSVSAAWNDFILELEKRL